MSTNWVKGKVLNYSDFEAAATTDTVEVYVVPSGSRYEIEDVKLERITDFSGGSISAYTISVGVSGAATKFMGAKDVFTGAKATDATAFGGGATREDLAGGTSIIATATSTSANLSTASAGKCQVWLKVGAIPVSGA